LVIDRLVGVGHAVLVGLDLEAQPLSSWPGTPSLLRETLARALPAPYLVPSGASAFSSGGGNQIVQALSNIPALDLPSLPLLLGMLVVYVLVVGPGSYLILRRLARREAAWLALPALVLVVSTVAYGVGAGAKGSNVLLNRIR